MLDVHRELLPTSNFIGNVQSSWSVTLTVWLMPTTLSQLTFLMRNVFVQRHKISFSYAPTNLLSLYGSFQWKRTRTPVIVSLARSENVNWPEPFWS